MRPTTVRSVTPTASSSTLTLTSPAGETLIISPLADDVVRVQCWPTGTPEMLRTWAVVHPDGSMPREGRRRDAPCAFAPAPFSWADGTLTASRLHIQVNLDALALRRRRPNR